MMSQISTYMGDHFMIVSTVSNLMIVCQTKLTLVNDNLSNNESDQYLYGWLLNNSKYCKQPYVCMAE